ncbi:MAG TPA: hypothetical protein VJ810_43190 [Blastocatellia bacterium]|nr:hypothetical protein [Blastocatellia bacterium]
MILLMLDQPRPKGDKRAFAEWRFLRLQTIERQLPAPIHQRRLDATIGTRSSQLQSEARVEAISPSVGKSFGFGGRVAGAPPAGMDEIELIE